MWASMSIVPRALLPLRMAGRCCSHKQRATWQAGNYRML
jgi:hypothetical protein